MPRERGLIKMDAIYAALVSALRERGADETTALLAAALMILAFLAFASGLILDTVTRGRWELKRLAYLAISSPRGLKLP